MCVDGVLLASGHVLHVCPCVCLHVCVHVQGAVVAPSEEDSQTFIVNGANGEVYKLRGQGPKERQFWVSRLRSEVEHCTNLSNFTRIEVSVCIHTICYSVELVSSRVLEMCVLYKEGLCFHRPIAASRAATKSLVVQQTVLFQLCWQEF